MEKCPLCKTSSKPFLKSEFLICQCCSGIFRKKKNLPLPEKEKARYELHQNDIYDSGYRNFVSPLTTAILNYYKSTHNGLDFGSGPSSAAAAILNENGYTISLFDPLFHNNQNILAQKFNYIICIEVMEHFHNPEKEFRLLKELLLPNGRLYCMTNIYSPEIDFASWYYKNDFTHVFFYQKETLEWIKENFRFTTLEISGNLILFKV